SQDGVEGQDYKVRLEDARCPGLDVANGDEEDKASNSPLPLTPEEPDMMYTLGDTVPLPLCILLGVQHFLMSFLSTPPLPLFLSGPLCMAGDEVGISELIGVNIVSAGIATLMQTTLGVRLPIVQGNSVAFLAPTLAILSLPRWQCPPVVTVNDTDAGLATFLNITTGNGSSLFVLTGSAEHKTIWQSRLAEVNGAILVAALLQVGLGFSGVLGAMLRYMGPLCIAPTIALIGLSLFEAAAQMAAGLWWIAILTVILVVVFSQCLDRVSVPIPCFSRRGHGVQRTTFRLKLFALFPVLLAVVISWLLCLVLTLTDVLPRDPEEWGHAARTDTNQRVLQQAPWVRIPYPGQWGVPTVTTAAVLGMMAGVLASILESVGDYYACAQVSAAPPPPHHAVNRGIGTEGLCCMIAAGLGAGSGSTSYSQNIAALGITKVASRGVILVCGMLLVGLGCVGKVGALFVTISKPIIGGLFIALFGMITAVGLSHLHHVDLLKQRNMCVLGLSLFLGLSVPNWVAKNKDAINTGSPVADQIFEVLLSTAMVVGGLVGFVLDNVLPGTDEERGIFRGRSTTTAANGEKITVSTGVYRLPFLDYFGVFSRLPCLGRLPFLPGAKIQSA
ncbi:hypothetical protein BaRGS_00016838, partial [Batillaria attramentaria]